MKSTGDVGTLERDESMATARVRWWRQPKTIAQWVVLAAPVALLVGGGWAHRSMVEDGFIYLRVVQHVRDGNGPVFNAGERVEAATGTLWVGVLSVADLITPIRLEWLAVLLGLGASAAGLWLAIVGSRRLWGGPASGVWYVPLGALVFAAILPSWKYATTGLETGLAFLWLGGSLYLLARWADAAAPRLSTPSAVVLGLGWLIRPELVLFSAAFLLVVLALQWPSDRWSDRARLVAAMVAIPLAYQVFRMGYFGGLVPNTGIAKEGSRLLWDRGWRYFVDFIDPYWLWLPFLALLAAGYVPLAATLRRARQSRGQVVLLTFFVCGALALLYMVAVGGDHNHARLLLPGFFALCAPVAVVPVMWRTAAGLVLVPWAIAAVLTLRPASIQEFMPIAAEGQVTVDDFEWGEGDRASQWYRGDDHYYLEVGKSVFGYRPGDASELDPDVPLPFGTFAGVGIAGYARGTDFHILDVMGLGDTLAAHLEIDPARPGYPGHEKPLPAPWIAARLTPEGSQPSIDNFPEWRDSPLTDEQVWLEQVAWARAALGCDEIRELLETAEAPMSVGRFLDNVGRAFSNHRLRIPADPEDAYHRFCGAGTPPEVETVRQP